MNVDYIIVGLGLAGIAFVEELIANNKSFVVFEDNSQNSSIVAGGVYNPVILKRFTPVWNGHEQLELALPFYERLSKKLGIALDKKFTTRKVFKSIEDENNWFAAMDKPTLEHYMSPNINRTNVPGVIAEYGFGILNGTGRIDTAQLIHSYKTYLSTMACIREERFGYEDIELEKKKLRYRDIVAKRIVFCEGYGIHKNPFFKDLPLREAKGELITIYAKELEIDFLLKSAVFVLPLGNHYYKVGATFNWKDKTAIPTEEGKVELVEKLKKVIDVPYTIVEQQAGIRPTVKDRRPMLGVHPKYKNLVVLNGLGTRGVMIAPTAAKELYQHLEKGVELDKEIDIRRFTK